MKEISKRFVNRLGGLSATDIRVYLWHLCNANKRMMSRASQDQISAQLGVHRISVTRSEKKLEAADYIQVRRHDGRRAAVKVKEP
jgi:DNA-binding MarR family transcriptional regulator